MKPSIQEMARRYWPNDDPIGKRLTLREGLKPMTIAGIIGDVRYSGMETEPDPIVYVSFPQAIFGHFGDWGMTLAVRSASDPLTFVSIAALLTVVSLLACWIPARRATKVDPLNALRHD